MNKLGTPKFQYRIPYEKDHDWYIIFTTKQLHFYFNSSQRLSFWQLGDLFHHFPNIDQEEFVSAIDFNEVAIICGINNGVKVDAKLHTKTSEQSVESELAQPKETAQESLVKEGAQEQPALDDGYSTDEMEHETIDEETKQSLVTELLKEEGLLNEDQKETVETEKTKHMPALISGYSSSEDEEEEDKEEDVEKKSELVQNVENHQEQDDQVEEDSELLEENDGETHETNESMDDLNNDLDLDLELDTEDSRKSNFLDLLDKLKSKISIYEPWSMVQEELISELATSPEYFSIDNDAEREQIFNEWCSKQSEEQTEEAKDEPIEAEEEVEQKFPTPVLSYFFILQDFKKEIKKSFYEEFYAKNHSELANIELKPRKMEEIYKDFKKYLNDFAAYEKSTKKSPNYDPTTNLKKARLESFLRENQPSIPDKEFTIDPSASDKENWINLANTFDLPETLIEHFDNFIVGDEKRLQCYLDLVQQRH